jgi:hypothetical protein
LKEKDLVRIQMCWQRVDFLSQAENALAMERAMAARTYVQGRKSYTFIAKGGFTTTPPSTGLAELTQLGKDVLDNPKDGLASIAHRYPGYWHWRWWQSYEDELANAEIIQANLDGIRQARGGQALGPLSKQIIESSEQIHNRHPSAGRWLGFTMADVMGHFTARIARLEMQRTLLVTAVGLKRYQLVYGHYPEHLAEMVPQFLDSQPLDPMDGKWLRYHLCEDGLYLLYSTGEDAVDSGGDGTPSQQGQRQWLRGRDAVWPFAASKDEIEAENRRIEAEQKAKGSGPNAEFRRRYGLDSTAPPPVAGTNASPK